MEKTINNLNNKVKLRVKHRKLLFYSVFISLPVLHYLVFYIYINFQSFALAFKEYDIIDGIFTYSLVGFKNFSKSFTFLADNFSSIKMSFLFLAFQLFLITPAALVFSFYIYKSRMGTQFFRVMLFLPSVLSVVVFGLIYRYICSDVFGWVQKTFFKTVETTNLLTSDKTQVLTVMFFNFLLGFGVSVLTYTGTMSGVNISLIESAQLDGCKPYQEFVNIIIPMIWPTIATLMLVSFSRVFTEQWQVFTLLERNPGKVENMGYLLYTKALDGNLMWNGTPNNVPYTVLSAIGLILTAFVLPLSLLMRWALNKFGPKAD